MIYSIENLRDTMDKAFIVVQNSKKTVLFNYTIKLKNDITNAKINLLNQNNMIYFNLPENKNTYIGTGKTIERHELKDCINNEYEIVSNSLNNNIMTFGISAFDPKRQTDFPWMKIPRQYFIIPEIILKIGGGTTLGFNIIIKKKNSKKKLIKYIQEGIENLLINNNIKTTGSINLSKKITFPGKNNYIKMLTKAIETINKTNIKKIVLSKMESYSIKGNINLEKITTRMENLHRNCFNFILKLNSEDYFLGSSPESIITIKKDNLNATALAGTSTQKSDLDKSKEIKEHSYVIKHIKTILNQYGTKIKQDKTNKLNLRYAYHLETKLSTKLKYNKHILEILNNLYPTPALSGYPKTEAIDKIKKLEPFDRGYYGGAVGVYNNKGEGSFYASIRSALIRKNKIYYFSGGGITKDSQNIKEWEETETKLKHIKSIMQPE